MPYAPFPWTPELEDEICDLIASGQSMRDVCKLKGMPSEAGLYSRMARDEAFAAKVTKARVAQQEHEVEACIHIADDATPEDVQVAKLRIWARQWRAAKLAPKKYGDKIAAEITGADGAPLLPPTIAVTFVRPSSPGEPSGEA